MDFNAKYKNDGLADLVELVDVEPEGNYQMPTPSLLQYYLDRKERAVWIDKDIDDDLFNEIRLIIQYNREDEKDKIPVEKRKPVRIYLNSYGGALDTCFAFLDIMKLSKTPIYTYNFNACMSAAALIFVNGHKRFAMPKSTLLFHAGSASGMSGTYSQVVEQTENYKRLMSMLHDNILEHTSISKAYLTKQLKKEWYLGIKEQQQYNCVDYVLEDMSQLIGKY